MTRWVWLDERDARAIHERTLLQHGGAPGIRDPTLLQSALARAEQLAAYDEDADIAALAAAYTSGVVRNHPFVDGNKRTGFVLGVLFLALNGKTFTASEEEAAAAMLMLAEGAWDEATFAAFLRDNVSDA